MHCEAFLHLCVKTYVTPKVSLVIFIKLYFQTFSQRFYKIYSSMPVQTRSQARSGQPPDLVTSPGDLRSQDPRRILRFRQASADVDMDTIEGGPLSISARGTRIRASITFSNCKDKRCKTCPTFVKSSSFTSNVTNTTFSVTNHTKEHITCHSQNIIYLLTCQGCGIQYVGETIYPFHKRNNQHRTEMNKHFEEHLETSCKSYSYAYQVIEKLPGTGYMEDGSIDEKMSKVRKTKEDEWIRKMRVIFPYGLCEKARNKENDCSVLHKAVGKSYKGFPIPRSGVRPIRSRERRNAKVSIITCDDFFTSLDNLFSINLLKTSFNQIRIVLDQTKKKVLKEIAFHILERSRYTLYPEREQWYLGTDQ